MKTLLPLLLRGRLTFASPLPASGSSATALRPGESRARARTVAALTVALLGCSAHAQPFYSLKDLGTLGGGYAFGTDINNAGEIVGTSNTSGNEWHAFLYQGGRLIDLGTFGGRYVSVNAINDRGEIVGSRVDSSGRQRAVLYSGGRVRDLGSLNGGDYSHATDINNAGEVIGAASVRLPDGNIVTHAFLYTGGVMQDLGIISNPTARIEGRSINDAGQIAGLSSTSTGGGGWLYTGNRMVPIRTGNGVTGYWAPRAINLWGQVTGVGNGHVFLYSAGKLNDLGGIAPNHEAEGLAINRWGQIVGRGNDGGDNAILFSGVLHNLNDLVLAPAGLFFRQATGINDSGHIVCEAVDAEGKTRCVLLTPLSPLAYDEYEAEDGALQGGTVLEAENNGFSGAAYVNFPPSGGSLTFRNVDGRGGRTVTLVFRYSNGSGNARTGELVVNGVSTPITFGTIRTWTNWRNLAVQVKLLKGANTIVLRSTGQDLANIDRLFVQ